MEQSPRSVPLRSFQVVSRIPLRGRQSCAFCLIMLLHPLPLPPDQIAPLPYNPIIFPWPDQTAMILKQLSIIPPLRSDQLLFHRSPSPPQRPVSHYILWSDPIRAPYSPTSFSRYAFTSAPHLLLLLLHLPSSSSSALPPPLPLLCFLILRPLSTMLRVFRLVPDLHSLIKLHRFSMHSLWVFALMAINPIIILSFMISHHLKNPTFVD